MGNKMDNDEYRALREEERRESDRIRAIDFVFAILTLLIAFGFLALAIVEASR